MCDLYILTIFTTYVIYKYYSINNMYTRRINFIHNGRTYLVLLSLYLKQSLTFETHLLFIKLYVIRLFLKDIYLENMNYQYIIYKYWHHKCTKPLSKYIVLYYILRSI